MSYSIIPQECSSRHFETCTTRAVFPMRQPTDQLEEYAAVCRRHAAAVTDLYLRRLFSDLASQWEELASLHRRIKADRKAACFP